MLYNTLCVCIIYIYIYIYIGWAENHFNNLHFRDSLETKSNT